MLPCTEVDPLVALTVWEGDHGWWQAWADPIGYLAVVERTFVGGLVEVQIEAVIHDERAETSLALLSDVRDWISGEIAETVAVVPRDRVSWATLIDLCHRALVEHAIRQSWPLPRVPPESAWAEPGG